MSDTAANAPATAAATESKPSTFLDKLSRFTIGKDRGELPEKDTGAASDGSENAAAAVPLTRWQKVKNHFRRFWIIHLVIVIIIAAIMLPILFIYIIPRIAQDLLNSGSIVIDGASILQPTSKTVMLKVESHVYVPGPFTVHTEPLHLNMFVPQVGSEYPMSVLELPENKIHKNTSMDTNGTILTPFVNYTSWQNFVHNTIFLDAGGLGLKGTVPTRLGKIKKFDLDLDKNVPSKGLNGFKGFTIDSARLQLPAEADGSNLFANATLPNQSVLTLEIGNTTVDILSGDLVIGTGFIDSLFLKPGNNSFSIRGTANLTTLLHNIGPIMAYQGQYIKNGYLQLTTRVTNIKYNGTTVPYYTEEMGKLPLVAETPLLGLLLNTVKGLLSGSAVNKTLVQEVKAKINENHADLHKRWADVADNSTELELVAKRHIEDLMRWSA
ncbi:uncharacterized protein TRUGW13939_04065 [Talaromyces rugulosus]|uniref:Uncharacterized protein n=1 Tax=Talaromyces rugulosus TaxID=121627 RepID=A0A7H8QSJ8_TALRU|nr:uncharacterized protein TRUGW13939_04065 [Talaromyces rugulosus]QKX56957.1 hypothetical protein TRUGW13939_04065 [Talaromyces rugulosus]